MIKLSHIGTLSILAVTAVFACSGCASVDSNGEDPQAGDVAEEAVGEAQDALVYSCANVSNANWPDGWENLETQVRNLVNQKRAVGRSCKKKDGTTEWKAAVPSLTSNTQLTCAARSHSKDMGENNLAATHTGSDGTNPETRAKQAGYLPYQDYVIENAGGGQTTADVIVNNWLNSSNGHCQVIMNPVGTQFGVGYYYKSTTTNQTRWTMDVGKPQ